MQIPEFSDALIKVTGRNGTDSSFVYWFSCSNMSRSVGGRFVTVGTLTAYGFVETVEKEGVDLLSDPQVRSAVMDRVTQLRTNRKYPTPKRGAPSYILKKCPFPESYKKKYKAMERAHFIGNQNLRVSMQTGQIVFKNTGVTALVTPIKFLSHEDDDLGYRQLAAVGIDMGEGNKPLPLRAKPTKPVKPLVVRLSPDTPSFYF